MANVVKMTIQFRRDTAANWEQFKHIIPAAGEPCFVIDKNILKIGDGETAFENLKPINGVSCELTTDGKSLILEDNILKLMGFGAAEVGAQPRKNADGNLEWVVPSVDVTKLKETVDTLQTDVKTIQDIVGTFTDDGEPILARIASLETKMDGTGEGTVDSKIDAKIKAWAETLTPDSGKVDTLMELINYVESHGEEAAKLTSEIKTLQELVGSDSVSDQIVAAVSESEKKSNAVFEHVKYEISHKPAGTLVNYRDKEIRVMCPTDTTWVKQNVGASGDANYYYMGLKAYAPEGAVSFKEDDQATIIDQTMYYFNDNDFAGIDEYGRKYSIVWLALASYDEATDTWSYFGAKSSVEKYIGWYYSVEWYDANGVIIESDKIRINLSNESCHDNIEPYYMSSVVKEVAINGTLLDIIDGRVDIVIPEQTINIKGSDEIEIAEDGTLSIKSISFDKIVQEEDNEIVLNGGGAAG